MKIITQDRMKIVDTTGCDIVFGADGEIFLRRYTFDRVRDISLGDYETREREKEVFEQLTQASGQIYEMPAE